MRGMKGNRGCLMMKKATFSLVLCMIILVSLPRLSAAQWVQTGSINGTNYSYIFSFTAIGTTLFAGLEYGTFQSKDSGATWTKVNSGLVDTIPITSFATGPNGSGGTIILASSFGGVFLSTNSGATWTFTNSWLPIQMYSLSRLAVSPNGAGGSNFFVGTIGSGFAQGVFVSKDNGKTWAPTNSGLPDSIEINNIAAVPNGKGGTTIVAGSNYRTFLSVNNGATWTPITFAAGAYPSFLSLAAIGTTLFAGTNNDGVFISTDNGASWTAASSGLTNYTINSFAVSGTNLFAGTGDGVFFSTNNARSWTPINFGMLPKSSIASLVMIGSNIFAVANRQPYGCVWRALLDNISVKKGITSHLSDNPSFALSFSALFGSYVTVSFSLPRSERVLLESYNLSGQRVATIVNNRLDAGAHNFLWATHDLPSGCYTLRMQAGGNVQVKMVPLFR
jgi:hypothetical protein